MNLMIVFPRDDDERVTFESCCCTANLCIHTNHNEITTTATTTIQAISNKDLLVCKQVLRPINGMICLIDKAERDGYDKIKEDHAVCLYNVITQEATTPWIKSTYLAEVEQWCDLLEVDVSRTCEFGFDPTTMKYKVICMWKISGWELQKCEGYGEYTLLQESEGYSGYYRMCEILTLGEDTAWRRIHKVPPSVKYLKEIYGSVYVNGSIYWIIFEDPHHILVAFDVGSEEYRVIADLDLLGLGHRGSFHLVDIDGHLAIQKNAIENNAVNLWMLDDDCDKNTCARNTTCNIKWTKEIIVLPLCWSYQYVRLHVVSGTEYLILECFGLHGINSDVVVFHAYNRKKKTFSKIEITGDESSNFS